MLTNITILFTMIYMLNLCCEQKKNYIRNVFWADKSKLYTQCILCFIKYASAHKKKLYRHLKLIIFAMYFAPSKIYSTHKTK